jgi:hypothetical protein
MDGWCGFVGVIIALLVFVSSAWFGFSWEWLTWFVCCHEAVAGIINSSFSDLTEEEGNEKKEEKRSRWFFFSVDEEMPSSMKYRRC